MVLLTFRVGLPSPAKSLWKYLHRSTQKCLLGNYNSIKSTMKMDSHRLPQESLNRKVNERFRTLHSAGVVEPQVSLLFS